MLVQLHTLGMTGGVPGMYTAWVYPGRVHPGHA